MQPVTKAGVFNVKKEKLETGYQNIHRDLIDKSINGDEGAMSKLYVLYSKAMFNSCLRITNNRDDAEDVLQEAFTSAFRNLKLYRGESAFGAWLKRIVINKAINHVNKKRLDLTELMEEKHDVVLERTDVSYDEKKFRVEKIKKAMNKLPQGYRIVFSLYLLEGYDHQEIGEILNITTSTSKSQFNRAKKKVRQLMEEI